MKRSTQPSDLVLEVMADVLRAIVMTDGQASSYILADGPKAFPHPLADGRISCSRVSIDGKIADVTP